LKSAILISLASRPAPYLLFLLLFALLCLTPTAGRAQLVNFKKYPFFYSITYPNKLEAANLNGDNIRDIVTVGDNGISVLNSTVLGQYQVQNYQTTVGLFSLGNFNNDQEPDMAATGYDSLYIIINSGNGNFGGTKKVVGYTGPSVGNPIVADFNNDGRDDVAVGNGHVADIRVFLQADTETGFAPPGVYAAGPTVKMEHGDFTGDGFEDIVVINVDASSFKILINAGNGTFGAPQPYSTLNYPICVAVADIEGDDDLDLIVGNSAGVSPSSISIYKNAGGVFSLWATYPVNLEYATTEFLTMGDINHDGFTDITYTDWSNGAMHMLYNDGAANFGSLATHVIGGQPRAVISDDFNNNGETDIAIANYSSIQVAYNQGDGSFNVVANGAGYPTDVAQADFNNDGSPDVAATNFNDRSISVMINDTQAKFLTKKDYIVGNQPYVIHAGALTGDANIDLVTANVDEDSVTILRGLGDGNFVLQKKYLVGNAPVDLAIADYNHDGQQDIMVLSTPLMLLLNTGIGFQSLTLPGVSNSYKICAGDLNGDNFDDIAISTSNFSSNLFFSLSNGDGTFGGFVGLNSQLDEVYSIAISDFNEDGIPDIGYKGDDYFYVLANNGNAVFSQSIYSTMLYQGGHLVTGDFDGNGKQDVAFGSIGSSAVSVLLKDEAGGYSDPILFNYPGGYLLSVAVANFDGDDKDDIAVVGSPFGYLYIWISLPRLQVSTDDFTREYGVANPPFTGTVTGWPGPYAHDIVFECSATILSSTGTYPIVPMVSDSIMQNFAVLKSGGILTITPVPLTIMAHDTVRAYMEENPIFRATVTGLRNNDTFPYSFYTVAELDSPPGEYPIFPYPQDVDNINYIVTTVEGTLTILEKVPKPYPNPSNGTFSLYSLEPLGYTILDSRGVETQTGALTIGNNEIYMSGSRGIYMIRLQNGVTLKVVVN
jgi:hypothetical protein